MEFQPLYAIIALAVATTAVYTDTRSGLIPNKVTFPAMAVGLGMHAVLGGWGGLGVAALGCAAGIGLLLIPFLIGNMGAGDVKLMGALGAFVGASTIFGAFVFSAFIGGAIGLVILLREHGPAGLIATLSTGVKGLLSPDMRTTRMTSFPYASAIFAGLFASLVAGGSIGL